MQPAIDLTIDVSSAAGLGIAARTAVTIHLPDEGRLADPPVVCFAFPGGGYCRRYYSFDMPNGSGGGEAGFHCDRGWIFVACDHLGFGDSTIPQGNRLTLESAAAANDATVRAVMQRLESGTVSQRIPPMTGATKLGIGQSMGGCFTVIAQARHGTFDGVAILGFSAIHTVVPTRPGRPASVWPWIPRNSSLDNPLILNRAAMAAAEGAVLGDADSIRAAAAAAEHPFQWSFHYDDEPADIVALDMAAAAGKASPLPSWRSATTPPCGIYMVAPGVVASEAASIGVPVLVAVGERDVVPDPPAEPKAYRNARDVTVYVCPRMGHMHNFAQTRALFWQRLHSWGTGVAQSVNASRPSRAMPPSPTQP
jgi:pimeloyl-ACP methyl ester carboxylesterase